MGKYYYSGSAEKVTVQNGETFDVIGYGAQGGSAGSSAGGYGAEIGGSFNLQKGEVLELFVGQEGRLGTVSPDQGGGGGGTFVLADVNAQGTLTPGQYTLLLAAGGGGGAGIRNGGNATVTPSGNGLGGAGGGGNYGAGGGAGFQRRWWARYSRTRRRSWQRRHRSHVVDDSGRRRRVQGQLRKQLYW